MKLPRAEMTPNLCAHYLQSDVSELTLSASVSGRVIHVRGKSSSP